MKVFKPCLSVLFAGIMCCFAVQAQPTEELYTVSSAMPLLKYAKWNQLYHYSYDSGRGLLLSSNTGASSALSENYFADKGPATVTPDLQMLFHKNAEGQPLEVFVGLKAYNEGDFVADGIPIEALSIGFQFVRTARGDQKTYLISEGEIIDQVPGFTEENEYRVRMDQGAIYLEVKTGAEFETYYDTSLDSKLRYHAFQGAVGTGSPFMNVGLSGFTASYITDYAYQFDGVEDLLDVFDGNVFKVLDETRQNEVLHQISWHHLQNVNGADDQMSLNTAITQSNSKQQAFGESVKRFMPSDVFTVELPYTGGVFSLGAKDLLNSNYEIAAGFQIQKGVLSIINPISGSGSIGIQTNDMIALNFTGNQQVQVQLNGALVATAALPASALNLTFSLSQGQIGVSNLAAAAGPGGQYGFLSSPFFSQNSYSSDCQQTSPMTLYMDNLGASTAYVPYEIYDSTTGNGMLGGVMNIPSQTSGIKNFTLPIGLYRIIVHYPNGQQAEELFEVNTPMRWNEANSLSSQVDFDETLFDNNSLSVLELQDVNSSFSKSQNIIPAAEDGSLSVPLSNLNYGKYLIEIPNLSPILITNTSSSKAYVFTNPGSPAPTALPSNTREIVLRVQRNAAPGSSAVLTLVAKYGFGQELQLYSLNSNPMNTADIELTLTAEQFISSPYVIKQAFGSVCPTIPPPPVFVQEDYGYAVMKRVYDANYYVTHGTLLFKFDEDYSVGSSQLLNFRILDKYSDDFTGNCSGMNLNEEKGDNRYSLDLESLCSGLVSDEFYKLEVQNVKGEKRVLRFLYKN